MKRARVGIGEERLALLERLHRAAKGPFTAHDAASFLALPVDKVRLLLRDLARAGWLVRVRRGLYGLVPLGATSPKEWREDPWSIAAKLWDPCYIGGWTALEHWHLTEQHFRDVVVFTARSVRSTNPEVQGVRYRIRRVKKSMLFGTRNAWREQTRVNVSDPTRTLIDVLSEPALGGGIQHVSECVVAYMESEHRSTDLLIEYGRKAANRALFKRLGYILETVGMEADLVERCRGEISAGISSLDPAAKARGTTLRRWNLRVNARVPGSGQ